MSDDEVSHVSQSVLIYRKTTPLMASNTVMLSQGFSAIRLLYVKRMDEKYLQKDWEYTKSN